MPLISIDVEADAWRAVPDVEAVVERAAQAALTHAGASDAEVTVLLADDDAVADLNQRFRQKSGPTNVLSFPAGEMMHPFLGDLALANGVCAREAAEQGKTLSDHLCHLVVHGVLHLLGRDHMTDPEAEAMEAEERSILAALGINDPYEMPQ